METNISFIRSSQGEDQQISGKRAGAKAEWLIRNATAEELPLLAVLKGPRFKAGIDCEVDRRRLHLQSLDTQPGRSRCAA